MNVQSIIIFNKPTFTKLVHGKPDFRSIVRRISANPSWLMLAITSSDLPSFPKFASSKRSRARRFSLGLNSVSTKVSPVRMSRLSRNEMKRAEKANSSRSIVIIADFSIRTTEHSETATAFAMRRGSPARHPSPKKSPISRTVMIVSLSCSEKSFSSIVPSNI